MTKRRKNYTPEEKVAILKRHLGEKVSGSDLCDELGLNPTVFYGWQKQFFENGAASVDRIRADGECSIPAWSQACRNQKRNPPFSRKGELT